MDTFFHNKIKNYWKVKKLCDDGEKEEEEEMWLKEKKIFLHDIIAVMWLNVRPLSCG